ncbi:unnamed protein product [Brassica oleracea]|uniref:Uncharacterized protein n=2 Tax=Brassica TaxID=3705 RepID=A0A3P6CSI3_BRAOL|nr:unnamed protein product [Brassica napus]VDD21797.1 unnamed protein product [Brassica oleracea]
MKPHQHPLPSSSTLLTLKWQPMAKGEFMGLVQFRILMMNQVRLHQHLYLHIWQLMDA